MDCSLETLSYCQHIPTFTTGYQALNKGILNLSYTFIEQSKAIISTLTDMASQYTQLSDLYNEVDEEELSDEHLRMSQLMKTWSGVYGQQKDIVQDKMTDFYEYHSRQSESLAEMTQDREQAKVKFIKQDQALTNKKMKLIKNGDQTKYLLKDEDLAVYSDKKQDTNWVFDVMLPDETQAL